MPDSSSGELTRLLISRCTEDSGNITVSEASDDQFEVMLNPTDYSYERSINYNSKTTPGRMGTEIKFNAMEASKVSFSKLIIDGTGAIGNASDDVSTQIDKLRSIIYDYQGDEHEPSLVRLLWGNLVFYAKLTKMTVKYTMFKPSGEPLRAEVDVGFLHYMSNEEEAALAQRESPDLSHVVEVQAGDTLPLLCYRIYKDCSYYLKVAKVNELQNLRSLKPGTKLLFPPLV